MRCEEVKINLPEYIDQKLDEKIAEAIAHHLESCKECNDLHDELKMFLDFTDNLDELEPPPGMKAEFLKMIETEIPQKPKVVVMVPLWLKVAAILIFILLTYTTGYYIGSEKDNKKIRTLEVALDQTKQQVFLASLQDFSGPQKIEAVYKISLSGQTGDALIDALVNTMNTDKNVNVRLAAINALTGMIGKNQRVKNELIRSLTLQNNPLLQISLIQVLTESGVREAKEEIESMSRNEKTDEKVKAFAKDMVKIII
ncbi:MAG: zf-HC2 domain-containing protein [Mariniphaga sp.]